MSFSRIPFTIPIGTSLSTPIATGGRRILGIEFPASWTTAAAVLRGGYDAAVMGVLGVNYASPVPLSIVSGRIPTSGTLQCIQQTISPESLRVPWFQLRSGSELSPVNQVAERTLGLVVLDDDPGTVLVMQTLTIPAGQHLSNEISTDGLAFIGMQVPDVWDTAEIGIMGGFDSGNDGNIYMPMNTGSSTLQITTGSFAAGCVYMNLTPAQWPNNQYLPRYVKVRSGTVGSPVNQTADRTFRLLFRQK